MEDLNIHTVFQFATELTIKAGQFARSSIAAVETCQPNSKPKENYADLVTETDHKVEAMLIDGLSQQYPSHRFIGEETVSGGEKCVFTDNPTWIIDPIDGTSNFVHRMPWYSISIALYVNKEARIGIVYNIPGDKLYTAIRGEGASCNGRPIKCSRLQDLNQSLVIAEFGNQRDENFLNFKVQTMHKVIKQAHGIRALGSAALNMCAVAAGEADAYYEFGLHVWDMAAGALICTEAGAVCKDPSGGELDLMSRKLVVACTSELTQQLCAVIGDYPVDRD